MWSVCKHRTNDSVWCWLPERCVCVCVGLVNQYVVLFTPDSSHPCQSNWPCPLSGRASHRHPVPAGQSPPGSVSDRQSLPARWSSGLDPRVMVWASSPSTFHRLSVKGSDERFFLFSPQMKASVFLQVGTDGVNLLTLCRLLCCLFCTLASKTSLKSLISWLSDSFLIFRLTFLTSMETLS